MDNRLVYIPHIVHVTCTVLKTFICRNTKEFTCIPCIKILFYTLVRSKLEYCCVIWSPHYEFYMNVLGNVLQKLAKYL